MWFPDRFSMQVVMGFASAYGQTLSPMSPVRSLPRKSMSMSDTQPTGTLENSSAVA